MLNYDSLNSSTVSKLNQTRLLSNILLQVGRKRDIEVLSQPYFLYYWPDLQTKSLLMGRAEGGLPVRAVCITWHDRSRLKQQAQATGSRSRLQEQALGTGCSTRLQEQSAAPGSRNRLQQEAPGTSSSSRLQQHWLHKTCLQSRPARSGLFTAECWARAGAGDELAVMSTSCSGTFQKQV